MARDLPAARPPGPGGLVPPQTHGLTGTEGHSTPREGWRGTRGDAGVGLRHPWAAGLSPGALSPWRGSPGTRCATLSPWGDSQPRGQPGSRGAPLTAGVLLMEGLTSTGAFPPPRRAARREELPKTRHGSRRAKPQLCPGLGGGLLHPSGHTLGTQGQPARPKIFPPLSPQALTGEAGLAPRVQAAARSSPVKHGGLSSCDPRSRAPSLAMGWGPHSGDILALPPAADSLDASAVLQVGQVAADGSEAGQDLGG